MLKKYIWNKLSRVLPNKATQFVWNRYYYGLIRNYSEETIFDFLIIKDLIDVGDWAVDIGAHAGVYTKYLSKYVGQSGRVFSFEPVQMTFQALSNTVKKLKLHNVSLFQLALSNQASKGCMVIPFDQNGNKDYYGATFFEECRDPLRGEPVQSETLDNILLAKSRRISFIKCDVEGNELNVLAGGHRIISRFRPALLIEVKNNKKTLDALLSPLGYYGYEIAKIEPVDPKYRGIDNSENVFYLCGDHLKKLSRNRYWRIKD